MRKLYHNFRNIVGQNLENMDGAKESKGLTSSNEKVGTEKDGIVLPTNVTCKE